MQRGRLLIILGIILGLATLGVVAFLALGGAGGLSFPTAEEEAAPGPQPESTEIPTTQVIVALQPIARGTEFVAGSIGRRDWPANNVPPDIIADEAETIGKVAKTDIVQGQVIVRAMLVDVGGGGEASLNIPNGRVAVAYPIDSQVSVSYAIQPGDSVDILITAFFLDVDEEFQTPLPNKTQFFFQTFDEEGLQTGIELSEPIDEGRFELGAGDVASIVIPSGAQVPRRVAQLTVQAAKVLRVGPWLEPPPPPPPEDGSPPPPPPLPSVVTLAVTPQDALVMLWLRQGGIYSEMALRAAGEDQAEHLTEAVTLQYMLTRFNIAVPPKIEFIMAESLQEISESTEVVEEVRNP
jgi:pilus assembly protein CpaB